MVLFSTVPNARGTGRFSQHHEWWFLRFDMIFSRQGAKNAKERKLIYKMCKYLSDSLRSLRLGGHP
jgi:hypothetical protein